MIFVTVGGHTPFDRLIRCIDGWVGDHPDVDFYAQIGDGGYEPVHMPWTRFMSPPEFTDCMRRAEVVVAHAGMGTILTGLDLRVPLLVMPRTAARRETRNDHQVATVKHLVKRNLVHVAADENEMTRRLDELDSLRPAEFSGPSLSPRLRDAIRNFIAHE